GNGVLAELLQVDRGAQRAADQALDFQCAAALLAAAGLAIVTRMGAARQHAVLGGDPALALALEEARYVLVHRRGAQYLGVAELHQYAAFSVAGVLAGKANISKLVGLTA